MSNLEGKLYTSQEIYLALRDAIFLIADEAKEDERYSDAINVIHTGASITAVFARILDIDIEMVKKYMVSDMEEKLRGESED